MDPCPFVRILIGNLALKFPTSSSTTSLSRIHPSTNPNCYCKIKLSNFPHQISTIPLVQLKSDPENEPEIRNSSHVSLAACFGLSKVDVDRFVSKQSTGSGFLTIEVFSGGGGPSCGLVTTGSKLLGKVHVALDLKGEGMRSCLVQNGWVSLGSGRKNKAGSGSGTELHLSVRIEPDPRFVFQFGGEPECSPQVFQVQGNTKQAVFTCKFGLRNSTDRMSSLQMSDESCSRKWFSSFKSEKDQSAKERKGWSITIHDLSGSPVAMASMVTPFVPSPGSDRVSRSNPGAWLILRPGGGTWKPWGRLDAWREPGSSDALGYRFELHDSTATTTAATANAATTSTISTKKGGKFVIDTTNNIGIPLVTPHGSCDFGSSPGSGSRPGSRPGSGSGSDFGFLPTTQQVSHRGFVMSSTIEGLSKCSKPEVEVGVQHVTCTEDAAAFVALAAALDLSMDACMLFSQKLRKELRQQCQNCVV